MKKDYIITFKEGGVGIVETLATGGLAMIAQEAIDNITNSHDHGWECTATDRETDLSVTKWGPTKPKAEAKARLALDDRIENFHSEQQQQRDAELREKERQRQRHKQPGGQSSDDTGSSFIGKLIGYVVVIVVVLWFISAVLIPLIMLDLAVILLLVGVTKGKSWKKYFLYGSILGAIYLLIDLNTGSHAKILVGSMTFFTRWIPWILCINIFAGLMSAYLLIVDLLNKKMPPAIGPGDFQKRNLVVMGSLFAAGLLTVLLQMNFGGMTGAEPIITPGPTAPASASTVQSPVITPRKTVVTVPAVTAISDSASNIPLEKTDEKPHIKNHTVATNDFYIINVTTVKTEKEAKEKVEALKNSGYKSDYLWIPDYASLSGANNYAVYIGPMVNKEECETVTAAYRMINPGAYGLLVSHDKKREQIYGLEKTASVTKVPENIAGPVSQADTVQRKVAVVKGASATNATTDVKNTDVTPIASTATASHPPVSGNQNNEMLISSAIGIPAKTYLSGDMDIYTDKKAGTKVKSNVLFLFYYYGSPDDNVRPEYKNQIVNEVRNWLQKSINMTTVSLSDLKSKFNAPG